MDHINIIVAWNNIKNQIIGPYTEYSIFHLHCYVKIINDTTHPPDVRLTQKHFIYGLLWVT